MIVSRARSNHPQIPLRHGLVIRRGAAVEVARAIRGRAVRAPAFALSAVAALAFAAVPVPSYGQGSDVTPFTLSTTDAAVGGDFALAQVGNQHGCKGGNTAPALQWAGVPGKAKGLAVTMFDKTARNGVGYWHWAVIDLPPKARTLGPKDMPREAKSGQNDFGVAGYSGPCPPIGEKAHSYTLTVWAMPDATLPFDAGSKDSEIAQYLAAHALGKAELTLTYKR